VPVQSTGDAAPRLYRLHGIRRPAAAGLSSAEAMTASAPITVALVEDEPATRARLQHAIERDPALTLQHVAGRAGDMIEWLREGRPDVLLVDLGLPDRPGLDVIQWCRHASPTTEIMVVTLFGDEANMISAFEAGARGYLLKDGTEDDLARHVTELRAGGSPMSPLIARQLVARLSQPAPAAAVPQAVERLSPREQELLALVARGFTYSECGRLLGISLGTVQTHVKSIYGKLAVHSKTEAVYEARQMGLLGR
jgi:DNA-binding NarL/FixJ family response regulator